MKKKLFSLLIVGLLSLTLVLSACGGDDTGLVDGDTYLLTIYRARDAGMTDGDRDEAVKKAIEEKFAQDTGIKISLEVMMYTNEAICDMVDVNFNNKSKNMEAIVHYLSEDAGSAITKYAKDATAVKDLQPLLEEYGPNILAKISENDTDHLADRAGWFNYDGTYYRTALTSYIKEGGFGILVRKDLMRQVKATTGIDPEDYDITNENHKNMTLSQFETVMRAIKEQTSVTTPVNGKPWDLGRVFATSFGVDTLNWGFDEDGNFVPSQFTENWDKYVDLMYTWSRDGIWESESNTTTDDQRVTNLIAGKCAAYIAYPTAEQLIAVAKRFYAANPTQELMVLAPFASEDESGNVLVDDEGQAVVNGNLKTPRGNFGMVVPYRAKNTEILIQFMNWVYASKDNYELCLYGVKGVDWVEGDPVTYNGVTYETWAYPADKSDEYLINPPYTGKYLFLQNINMSNRICAHYSTVEKKWYTSLYFDYPAFSHTESEGIWIPEAPRSLATQAATVDGEYVDNIRSYAWVGKTNAGKTPTELLAEYVTDIRSSCADYLSYVSQSYKDAQKFFEQKYAD